MGKILIEVCVDSIASACSAECGGAGRIELCSSLFVGGVTPSTGLIELARKKVEIGLHVMIRPRGGDFCYDDDEFEVMRRDIIGAKQSGADGVVFGILDLDGHVDVERTRQLIELARPLTATFHRAFDMSADLFRALEDVCSAGADRILTSGGQQTSVLGREMITRLVGAANGRVIVMPGGGIHEHNAADLIQKTGAREIHAGLRSSVQSAMRYRNPQVSMSGARDGEYLRFHVLEESVRSLHRAIVNL
ncbi:MAG: copper homeostasis protein CutC [Candidatus Sulfotelmatobacter sp.]